MSPAGAGSSSIISQILLLDAYGTAPGLVGHSSWGGDAMTAGGVRAPATILEQVGCARGGLLREACIW